MENNSDLKNNQQEIVAISNFPIYFIIFNFIFMVEKQTRCEK